MTSDTLILSESATRLLGRARRYCAYAEQVEDDVRRKLSAWGATGEESDVIVTRLLEEQYLDPTRYARHYCESKLLVQHWGRQKVVYQLRQKHLPAEAIEAGLASVDDEDYGRMLLDVATAKARGLDLTDRNDKARLMRFLASRGFTTAEITAALKALRTSTDTE